jgi:hypothetical protein
MVIDGAGDQGKRTDNRKADSWAIHVVGVVPFRDDMGWSDIYLLDSCVEDMDLITAQSKIIEMYLRAGRVLKLGIEKVGMSTTEIHIAAALRAKGKHLSVEHGNLEILKPGGRSKEFRIESALSLPLKNGKIHVLDTIPIAYRERLGLEMEKFPAWKDDALDSLSYVYDIIKEYRFGLQTTTEKPESPYDAAFRKAAERRATGKGWITV